MEYHLTIKELPADSRPRERLATLGPQALSHAELLAIILGSGTHDRTAIELANQVLARPEGVRFLAEATWEELMQIQGIGPAKASQIKAAVELGRRLVVLKPDDPPQILAPQDAAHLVMEDMRYLDREHFQVFSLNTKNRVLALETVAVGTLNTAGVHPREVFKNPIKRSAAAVILVHNHPSGDPAPSYEDIAITKQLMEAGNLLGIEVLDHLIIGNNRFISLKEQGLV